MKSSLLYKTALALLLLNIIAVLSVTVWASESEEYGIIGYAQDGYVGNERGIFAPADAIYTTEMKDYEGEADVLILKMVKGICGVKGLAEPYIRTNVGGVVQFSAEMIHPEFYPAGEFELRKDYADIMSVGGAMFWNNVSRYDVDISRYSELRVGVSVIGEESNYPVVVEIVTDSGTYTSRIYIKQDGFSLLTVDVSTIEGIIKEFRIRVCFDETNIPIKMKVTEAFLTTEQTFETKHAANYLTDRFSAHIGTISEKTARIKPVRGDAFVEGKFISANQPKNNTTAYFEIKLTGVQNGKLSLGLLYRGASEEQRMFYGDITLDSPDGIYTIPVEVYDEIISFALQFDNVECITAFTVSYVKVYLGERAHVDGDKSLGTVQNITRDGNKVKFSGVIERDAAAAYSGQKIYFYAIEGNYASDLSRAKEIGSTKISTRFEYTSDLSKYPADADTFMFFAAVYGDNGELIPICAPRYCDAAEMPQSNVTSMGIYGGASVGVFESNMSHVIVDVPLDRVVNPDDNSPVISTVYTVYGEDGQTVNTITFSREVLSDIDRDVNFYISAGIKVYLRLTAAKQIDGLTYLSSSNAASRNIKNFAIDAHSSSSRQMYAAIVRFLSQRYGSVDGFIMGMAVNNAEMNGGAESIGEVEYSASLADLCRITYNAAAVYSPDVFVIVPFSETGKNTNTMLPDRSMAVMFADTVSHIGDIPWTFMYIFDSADDNISSPVSLDSLLDDLDLRGAGDIMYFFEPTGSYVSQRYESYLGMIETMKLEDININPDDYIKYTTDIFLDLYDDCLNFAPRAVFFSVIALPLVNSHEFYSNLKNARQDDSFVHGGTAVEIEKDEVGKYLLWDFSDKYYSLDWISVGGNSYCMTEYSEIFNDNGKKIRVLKAGFSYDTELTGISGGSGIALCNFRQSVDFSDISEIEFSFALDREDGRVSAEHATVVFVVGNPDYRAEYYTDSIELGRVYTMACDLSEYAFRTDVDYVGIMVYSDADICLELSDVGVKSKTLSAEEIGNIFSENEEEKELLPNYMVLSVFMLITLAFSVFICILLVRYDKEEIEVKKAAELVRQQKRLEKIMFGSEGDTDE